MKFCPKCKGLLVPTKEGLVCRNCGYKEAAETVELKEEIEKKPQPAVESAGEKEIEDTRPTIKTECPKCGHKEAYWYTQQTRAADEAETQFFICKKCGHRWRKYQWGCKIEFCPKCKTLMLPSKKTATCPRCRSRVKAQKSDIVIKEKITKSVKEKVAKRAKEIEATFPTAKEECPKCKNKKAYWWVQRVRGGEDEPETQFFRCTKCRYTWRKSA